MDLAPLDADTAEKLSRWLCAWLSRNGKWELGTSSAALLVTGEGDPGAPYDELAPTRHRNAPVPQGSSTEGPFWLKPERLVPVLGLFNIPERLGAVEVTEAMELSGERTEALAGLLGEGVAMMKTGEGTYQADVAIVVTPGATAVSVALAGSIAVVTERIDAGPEQVAELIAAGRAPGVAALVRPEVVAAAGQVWQRAAAAAQTG